MIWTALGGLGVLVVLFTAMSGPAWQKMQRDLDALAAAIGEQLTPAIVKCIEAFDAFGKAYRELLDDLSYSQRLRLRVRIWWWSR